MRIGAIADDVMAARDRHVEHRHAVDRNPNVGEIAGNQARRKPHKPALLVESGGNVLEACGRGIGPPMRRPEPLHAAAFLIDQDFDVGPAECRANIVGQGAKLRRIVDIAFEENDAIGLLIAQKSALLGIKREAAAAADEGTHQRADICG